MRSQIGRISDMHLKDSNPAVKSRAVANRTGFHDACGQGLFCNPGTGDVDFASVRQILPDAGFSGGCVGEPDCDPQGGTSPIGDARLNHACRARHCTPATRYDRSGGSC